LRLLASAGLVAALLLSTVPVDAQTDEVVNIEWRWTAADDPSQYTIVFLENGTFHAQADCNASAGGYNVEGDGLALSLGPTTFAQCAPGSLFDQYLGGLAQVTSFSLDGDNLVLGLGAAGDEMIFAPGDPTGAPAPPHNG
jgi:heat shock protein HslJ